MGQLVLENLLATKISLLLYKGDKASADKILRDVCLKLEIEGVSTHSFRRTALTRMSDKGVPLKHIQAISGHKTLAALERYLGVTEQQKESAIATLDF